MALIFLSNVEIYSDDENIGFKGYDFYFLNSFDIEVSSKRINIEINDDKLFFEGEYVLNNKTDKINEITLGIPSENAENLIIYEKSNILKTVKRNESFIEKNFISEHLPKSSKWSTFTLWLKANESRLITIKYESKVINDNKGVYTLNYINNIQPNNTDTSISYIKFNEFKPYNIIDISNAEIEKAVYFGGNSLIFDVNKNGRETIVNYELTDKLAVDRLDFSSNKKLKSISASFKLKDYETVIVLCDEYINNPVDNSVNINQVKFVKAEAYRNLVKYDNYFEILKGLDIKALFPYRVKYKILTDIDEILVGKVNIPELSEAIESIRKDMNDSNEFISMWYTHNNLSLPIIDTEALEHIDEDTKNENPINKYFDSLKQKSFIKIFIENKLIYIIIPVITLLIGYLIGKSSRKRRKGKSYYTLR